MKKKRTAVRFDPDDNAITRIAYEVDGERVQKTGLLYDESYSGCSIILTGKIDLSEGQSLYIKPGKLEVTEAEVRRIEQLDDKITKLGILYILSEEKTGS